MKRFAVVLLGALLLAGCQTTGMSQADFDAPLQAGETRIRFPVPNPDKWAPWTPIHTDPAKPQDPRWNGYACKLPACAASSGIAFLVGNSPTRHPVAEGVLAISKNNFSKRPATDTVMQAPHMVAAKYLSAEYTVKREKDGKINYGYLRIGFIGDKFFRLESWSQEEMIARKHMEELANTLEIKTSN